MSQQDEPARGAPSTPGVASSLDAVIEVYKKNVDRTLLRENLKLTYDERIRKARSVHETLSRVRGAAWPGAVARSEKDEG